MVSVEEVTSSWARILKVSKERNENQSSLLSFHALISQDWTSQPFFPPAHILRETWPPSLVQGSSRKYPPSWAGCPRRSLAAVAVSAQKGGDSHLTVESEDCMVTGSRLPSTPYQSPFPSFSAGLPPIIHFSAPLRSKVLPASQSRRYNFLGCKANYGPDLSEWLQRAVTMK